MLLIAKGAVAVRGHRRARLFCGNIECAQNTVEEALDTEREDEGEEHLFIVDSTSAGERLDKLLVQTFPGQSRAYYQELVRRGFVHVDGEKPSKCGIKLRGREEIEVRFALLSPSRGMQLIPEDIPLDIVYEDEHIAVVNKPAGLVVHPAPGNWTGTLVQALAYRYRELLDFEENEGNEYSERNLDQRPGIVHRLDKGTSGLLVTARTPEAKRSLVAQFASREVKKSYLAICVGNPVDRGCIQRSVDIPIGRHPRHREKMTALYNNSRGRPAQSEIELLAQEGNGNISLVRVSILTGRTHQIRVHLQYCQAPVLGDDLYGVTDVNRRFRSSVLRPLLHSYELQFKHPVTDQSCRFLSPIPSDMRRIIEHRLVTREDRPLWFKNLCFHDEQA